MQRKIPLKLNMILNALKSVMNIIFPLITFPYISRTLGVSNIGRYNFATSINAYFILFADLGISVYAIREGTRVREEKNEIASFASEMFTINMVSSFFSFILLTIVLLLSSRLYEYRVLLFVLSFQILTRAFNVEWIYSIYEDYLYITLRSFVFQIVSLIFLFIFIKTENDVIAYTTINSLSVVLAYFLNYYYSKNYCDIKLIRVFDWKKHIRPIFILFSMNLTVTIYVASDVTILGFLCGDYTVGIYAVSTKIYGIVKTIISSVLIVSIPRLSYLLKENSKHDFEIEAAEIYKILLTVLFPCITGLILLRKGVIRQIASEDYMQAGSSLALLCIALFFCMGAWFWGQCVLVLLRKELTIFKITIISAMMNIVFNFILIPIYKENAAAITTILAEAISYICCMVIGRKAVRINGIWKMSLKIGLGCGGIVGIFWFRNLYAVNSLFDMIVTTALSVIFYIIIEILCKNEVVINILLKAKQIVINKKPKNF